MRFLASFVTKPGPIERFEPFVTTTRWIAENVDGESPLLECNGVIALEKFFDKFKQNLEWVVAE